MVTHDLKTWRCFFRRIMDGTKRFEIRENDRDFQAGDRLRLIETADKSPHGRTGNEVVVDVTYACTFKQREGYIVMGIQFAACDQCDYDESRVNPTLSEESAT